MNVTDLKNYIQSAVGGLLFNSSVVSDGNGGYTEVSSSAPFPVTLNGTNQVSVINGPTSSQLDAQTALLTLIAGGSTAGRVISREIYFVATAFSGNNVGEQISIYRLINTADGTIVGNPIAINDDTWVEYTPATGDLAHLTLKESNALTSAELASMVLVTTNATNSYNGTITTGVASVTFPTVGMNSLVLTQGGTGVAGSTVVISNVSNGTAFPVTTAEAVAFSGSVADALILNVAGIDAVTVTLTSSYTADISVHAVTSTAVPANVIDNTSIIAGLATIDTDLTTIAGRVGNSSDSSVQAAADAASIAGGSLVALFKGMLLVWGQKADSIVTDATAVTSVFSVLKSLFAWALSLGGLIGSASDAVATDTTATTLVAYVKGIFVAVLSSATSLTSLVSDILILAGDISSILLNIVNELAPAVSTPYTVSASGTSVTMLTAGAFTKGATVINEGNCTMYIQYGRPASNSDYVAIVRVGDSIDMNRKSSESLNAIWVNPTGLSVSGQAQVTAFNQAV